MFALIKGRAKDVDGFPLVGTRAKCLGVRPTGPNADVDLETADDPTGRVVSNEKGMSVTADWRMLPGHLIPEHLDDGINGASGKNMAVFVHGSGSGPFGEGALAPGLDIIFKARTKVSGVVRPVVTVLLSQYQADLAATRPDWLNDEN